VSGPLSPPSNCNVCLFLFGGSADDIAQGLAHWPKLQAEVLRCHATNLRSVAHLGGPDVNELQRIVDYTRLGCYREGGRHITVNWEERKKLVARLVAEDQEARHWLTQFYTVGDISRASAQKHRWIKSLETLDNRTAQERLAAMTGLKVVKERIAELMDYVTDEMQRREAGLPASEPPSLHLILTLSRVQCPAACGAPWLRWKRDCVELRG